MAGRGVCRAPSPPAFPFAFAATAPALPEWRTRKPGLRRLGSCLRGFSCPCLHAPNLSWWLALFPSTSILVAGRVPTRVPVMSPWMSLFPHMSVSAVLGAPCAECKTDGARTLRPDGDADVGVLSRYPVSVPGARGLGSFVFFLFSVVLRVFPLLLQGAPFPEICTPL